MSLMGVELQNAKALRKLFIEYAQEKNHSGLWFLGAGKRPILCHRLIKYIKDEVSKSSVGNPLKPGTNSNLQSTFLEKYKVKLNMRQNYIWPPFVL